MPRSLIILVACVGVALATTTSASAERISTTKIPLAATLTSPCTGDVITFNGRAVLTVTEDVDPSGSARLRLSGSIQDPRAVGLLYSYNFKDQLRSADYVKVGDVYKAKFTNRMHFIRLGSGGDQHADDLFVTVVIAATINSDLVLTADRIDYLVDCR
jgi:hypothetical protein